MNPGGNPLDVLTGIPGFSAARIIRSLSNGPTNRSFEVALDSRRFVLRLDKPRAAELGRDREAEKQICTTLAAAGLAPEPVFFEPSKGVYLRPYLQGRAWSADDVREPENLRRLAAVLRQLHAIPAPPHRFDPLAAARRYAEQLDTDGARKLLRTVEAAAGNLPEFTPALCHNDLVCQNILEANPLTLIDWEYAGAGDPIFDLAVVLEHHRLDQQLEEVLLASYLRCSPASSQVSHLRVQRKLYASLLELWNLRVHG